MDPSRPSATLGWAGILACTALVLVARLLAIRVCHVYDDAFITYRYAANLARGDGLVYHPGAPWEPVLGTTTPGYAAWLAAWMRLGASAVTASLATNVACDVASAALVLRALARHPLAAAVAVAGFACSPELARIAAGGMEAPVLLALVLAAASAHAAGRAATAGVLAALACAVRPEAVLFAALLALESLRPAARARRWRTLVPMLATGGALALAAFAYYGSPVPQSVVAKASRHAGASLVSTWREILEQSFVPSAPYWLALPLVVLGLVRGVRGRGPLALVVRFGLAIVASYLAARPHTWGWYYYVPLAGAMIALGLGVERVVELVTRHARDGRAPLAAGLERIAPLALPMAGALALLVGTWGRADRVSERVYAPLRAWAGEARLGEGSARVLASDIGALGYYGGGRVLDTEGLVWPDAVAARGEQLPLIREHRPEYLMITATRGKLAPLRADPDFARDYVAIRRFSARGESALDPPLEELAASWSQDYIVYRRRE